MAHLEKNDNWLSDKPLSEWYGIKDENSNSKFIKKLIYMVIN